MTAGVLLIDPKFPHNVGGALRACSVFGVPTLRWTGARVPHPAEESGRTRLPREERMRACAAVDYRRIHGDVVGRFVVDGFTPVCVEVLLAAEALPDFVHPERAVYVFGPEDGSVPKGVRHACHRFVQIPAASCLNLAAAVNVVLYDRAAKGLV